MDIEEVRNLVDRAISAANKKEARGYIDRLGMLKFSADLNPDTALEPYTAKVFGNLISSVKAASGPVRDKDHWIRAVDQDLYKLEYLLRSKGDSRPQA